MLPVLRMRVSCCRRVRQQWTDSLGRGELAAIAQERQNVWNSCHRHPDRTQVHRMPILTDSPTPGAENAEWIEPDDVPRPAITFGVVAENLSPIETDFHRHRKAQLMMLVRGIASCEVESGLWTVPPQHAIWVPGGVLHNITIAGRLEGYTLFIDPAVTANMPAECCSIAVSPLLRELMIRSASFPLLYPEGGIESHVVTLLLDEIAAMPTGNLHLPMPTDARLRKIATMIMAAPADRGTMHSWAARAGLSERTMARILPRETGMSFGRWRQQIHLMLAVRWLGTGSTVQSVAERLGYESAGSFVTMFRKALGTSPGRYMAERR
ncbi:AraC-like DNA-binding protein/mannose-6-phosphate isomerase-like protein (cupin superfamily) [Luteibacter sp. 1214]|uniref:AraC family transcriptional regulator n=1 Tax=Luteibacter sp. 1214 TaxID=2817735 RepID=UPI0028646FB9|nr:helix-turn-helix transcriptional regulator [Luteibacter sp. 1214]MDR6640971.1 AraC-like DNA-binding protein/mannose-6-phosphate isomerase-like protein (cupin superfamily) [Luteibacter sp. 1214]